MNNRIFLFSGFLVPVVFWSTLLVCGWMRADYDHTVHMVSELGALGTQTQTPFTIGLSLTALLSVLFVIGLRRSARINKLNTLPIWLILTFSVSIFGAAIFPFPLRLHGLLGSPSFLFPLSPLLAIFLWNPQKIKGIRWASGLILIIMLLGFLTFIPSILENHFGLKQRFFHIGWSLWFVYLAIKFLNMNSYAQRATRNERRATSDEQRAMRNNHTFNPIPTHSAQREARSTKHNTLYLIFAFLGGLVLLFILAPLLGMVFATPLSSLFETAREGDVQRSIWLTIWVSMSATVVFGLAAIPFSWLLARKSFFGKKLVMGIIDLPIVIPHTAAGIAVLGVVSRDSVIGKLGSSIGLDFVGHPAGIALAMAFVSLPFLINAARDGFASVPERLEKAALTLGASPTRVFFTISLPLAWRNILSGAILMFARGMSEFGAVIIIAYHPMVAPVLIYERFGSFGLNYARPAAILFIVVSLLVFIGLRMLAGGSESGKSGKSGKLRK
jgi:molybdate/tungstate transport system permease protein